MHSITGRGKFLLYIFLCSESVNRVRNTINARKSSVGSQSISHDTNDRLASFLSWLVCTWRAHRTRSQPATRSELANVSKKTKTILNVVRSLKQIHFGY